MNARRCLNLISAAIRRRNARDLFFRWVVEGHSRQISFEEFKDRLKPQEKKSAEDILGETKNILENAKWQAHSLS